MRLSDLGIIVLEAMRTLTFGFPGPSPGLPTGSEARRAALGDDAVVRFLLLHGRFGFRRRDARLFFRHGLSRRTRRRGSRLFPRNRFWRGRRDQARNFLARVRVDSLVFVIARRFVLWRRAARIIAGSVAGDGLFSPAAPSIGAPRRRQSASKPARLAAVPRPAAAGFGARYRAHRAAAVRQ